MFDSVVEWFKGMFGGAAEESVQEVTDTVQGYGEAVRDYSEGALDGAAEAAQGYGEAAFGQAGEAVQGFHEQSDAVGGLVEDPGGAVTDAVRDRFTGEGG